MDAKLDIKTILEKDFKTGLRGYHQEEVDLFLDDVIQDYQTFKKRIEELQKENTRIKAELDNAEKRPATGNTSTTNFDLLKRISNLERHVFGSKLHDQE